MSSLRWVAYDTETALIRPGVCAPELSCVTICRASDVSPNTLPSEWPGYLLDRHDGMRTLRALLEDDDVGIVGQHIAFDMTVIMAEDPTMVPVVFAAYEKNRVTDTKLRQQLLDISAGCYRGDFTETGRWIKYDYSLDALSRRLLGWTLDKDTWRLRYGELRDTPLSEWPEGATRYPVDDARATLGVFLSQEEQDREGVHLLDQFRMARKSLWLTLCSVQGLRTDPIGVEKFAREVETEIEEVKATLVELGLIRTNGVRDTKAAAALMRLVCAEKGMPVIPTKTGAAKIRAGEADEDDAAVALDADACKRADDWRLSLYAKYSILKSALSKDIPMLRGGTDHPIHTRFDMAETGRVTSSKPNIQNIHTV